MAAPAPPIAARKESEFTHHGITVADPYAWLKDPGYPDVSDPEILGYLEAENEYFAAHMAPRKDLIDTLFEELKGRQAQEDASVPYEKNGYLYQWRYETGSQYRIWLRASVDDPENWSTFFDEPAFAEGHDYFRLGALAISPDGHKLAYSIDTDGSERFTLSVIDISSRAALIDPIENTLGSPIWNSASDEFYYVEVNEQWRPCRVHHRRLDTESPRLVYEESDDSFFVGLDVAQSEEWVFITTADHVTSETRFVARSTLGAEPTLIATRETGHEYDVDHWQDHFVIRSNREHANFDLFTAPIGASAPQDWETFISGSSTRYITGYLPLAGHLIVTGRDLGLDQVWIYDQSGEHHAIDFGEAAYSVGIGANPNYDSNTLRLGYASMVTPQTVFDYDIAARTLTTRKVQEIPSGYDADKFTTQRLEATARDGATVPISLVYHVDTPLDGSAPVYLYAYGAYGHATPPSFSASRISLVERGFIYAIAHIRGGDDLGYDWYTQGKLAQRTNTFNDFVDCARHLVHIGTVRPGNIAIMGGSAGGELMGAVVNQAPDLWGAVVAHVPFVDVLNTMLDADLPLTPIEWPEWGNPLEDEAAFKLIRSYSPYDQVEARDYPPMLVTAGLNDPRVTYWEPAKWVAKLRHAKTDGNPLLLKTNMGAGHGGKSGRFDSLYEVAEEYAFVLTTLGVA